MSLTSLEERGIEDASWPEITLAATSLVIHQFLGRTLSVRRNSKPHDIYTSINEGFIGNCDLFPELQNAFYQHDINMILSRS